MRPKLAAELLLFPAQYVEKKDWSWYDFTILFHYTEIKQFLVLSTFSQLSSYGYGYAMAIAMP